MSKTAKIKRVDGDRSELPFVVKTSDNELVRVNQDQARSLADASSPSHEATLDYVRRALREGRKTDEGIYVKTFPFPKSPQIAESLYRSVGHFLSSRIATAIGGLIGVVGLFTFIFDGDLHTLRSATAENGLTLVLAMILWELVLGTLHELGHALTLIRFGQPIKGMGICFFFGSPAFYTDSTLSLLLNKRQRIIQSGAGVWVDFVVAGMLAIGFAIFRPEGTLGSLMVNSLILTYFMGWINLAPIMKLDGYWMLSDALGRPQLLNEGFAALRTNWRSALGLYGLVSAAATVGLLISSVIFGYNSFHRVLLPTWNQSLGGKVVVIFFVFVAIVSLAGPLISAINERRRRRDEDLEFADERDERIHAAEVWDELPWEPEFTGEELGVLAGALQLFETESHMPLTKEGEVPEGVFIVLGAEPYVVGLESLAGKPSTKTTVPEDGVTCALLLVAQARSFVGTRRLT